MAVALALGVLSPIMTAKRHGSRSADMQQLAARLTAAREQFSADIARGLGGRTAHARFSDRLDDLLRQVVGSDRSGVARAAGRLRHGRVRPANALPALGHRPADRLRWADRTSRGALRQGCAPPALGPSAHRGAPDPHARGPARDRTRQSRAAARPSRPAADCRRALGLRGGGRTLPPRERRLPRTGHRRAGAADDRALRTVQRHRVSARAGREGVAGRTARCRRGPRLHLVVRRCDVGARGRGPDRSGGRLPAAGAIRASPRGRTEHERARPPAPGNRGGPSAHSGRYAAAARRSAHEPVLRARESRRAHAGPRQTADARTAREA